MLKVLHQDDTLLVVDKPAGLLAHPSRLAADEGDSLLGRLRDQLGRRVYLAHRLDRATSGVLVATFAPIAAARLGAQFMARDVQKTYLALVRGWPEPTGTIDHPLDAPGRSGRKPARTHWRVLRTIELPIAVGRYASARWALVAAQPETGRYRQIRRHFHHIHHHLLGDTSHGDGRHNRALRTHFGVHRLMLHAWQIAFAHPSSGRRLQFCAPPDAQWQALMQRLGWALPDAEDMAAGTCVALPARAELADCRTCDRSAEENTA